MVEDRGNKWNLEDLAGYIIIGFFSRVIGFILRTVIIFIGLFCLLITVVAGFLVYVFWLAAPLIIISLVVFGVTLLLA